MKLPKSKTIVQIRHEHRHELNGCERINVVPESIAVITELIDLQDEVFAATEHVKIKVAADSGVAAHCAHPRDLPDTVKVDQNNIRNFIAADGQPITHFGNAKVRLQQENGKHTGNTFQVMNVCRPLHSVSMITDNDYDMLFTKTGATVVPAGVFDKILAVVKHVATDPRQGGLYVAEAIVKDPDALDPDPRSPAPSAGQGAGQ